MTAFCNDCAALVGPTGKVTLCASCANRTVIQQRHQLKEYQERLQQLVDTCDLLGLALVGHDHQWTPKERKAYEAVTRKK